MPTKRVISRQSSPVSTANQAGAAVSSQVARKVTREPGCSGTCTPIATLRDSPPAPPPKSCVYQVLDTPVPRSVYEADMMLARCPEEHIHPSQTTLALSA